MLNFLSNIKNSIDFFLRRRIRFSRKNYCEVNQCKVDLEFSLEDEALENYLVEKYNLVDYKNNSTIGNYCQNLYTIYFLDKFLMPSEKENMSVLDIGSKNWFYCLAEYKYFKRYCENLSLDGVEIDPYRLYSNFYNRYQLAAYYSKDLENTNYVVADFMDISDKYDHIIWILPFVTISRLKSWGLPDKYFIPQQMLNHAYSLLNEGGKLLIINQGDKEFAEQKKLIKNLGIEKYVSSPLPNKFFEYKKKRFITVISKGY